MKRFPKWVAVVTIVALTLLGCDTLVGDDSDAVETDPLEDLVGEWLITSNPQDITPHHTLVFNEDSTYEILDADGVVYERGPMSDITDTGFEYVIEYIEYEENDPPADRYASYTITGDTLEIAYFRDSTMEERFVGFGATRQ